MKKYIWGLTKHRNVSENLVSTVKLQKLWKIDNLNSEAKQTAFGFGVDLVPLPSHTA